MKDLKDTINESGEFKAEDLTEVIAGQLIDEMPGVSESAILASETEKAQETKTAKGETFDPTIHDVDENGDPKITKGGTFAKKRGRKAGYTPKQTTFNSPESVKPAEIDQARMTGIAAANMLITLGLTIGGDEFQPIIKPEIGLNEKENLETAFTDYCRAKEITDIPPGVALCLAVGGYILPRFTMPKTQTRMQKVKVWFYTKYMWFKNKRRKHADNEA